MLNIARTMFYILFCYNFVIYVFKIYLPDEDI